jgi:hypothetical protein
MEEVRPAARHRNPTIARVRQLGGDVRVYENKLPTIRLVARNDCSKEFLLLIGEIDRIFHMQRRRVFAEGPGPRKSGRPVPNII